MTNPAQVAASNRTSTVHSSGPLRRGPFRPAVAAATLLAAASLACSLVGGSGGGTGPEVAAGELADPAAGLQGLSSYRASLSLEFEGTRDGAPLSWSQHLVLETDRAASARLLSLDRHGVGAGQEAQGIVIGQFGGMSLMRPSAEGACRGEVVDTPLVVPEPASLLRSFRPVDTSGEPELWNGVPAYRAELDPAAVAASEDARVTGEVWVAADGGYVLHYVLEIDGDDEDWGEGIQGVTRWEYEVEAVGQDLGLLPPLGCPLGQVEAPLPDDAAQVVSVPGSLTLTTDLDVTAAAEFYRQQLPPLGWAAGEGDFLTPRAARLTFTQRDRLLVVTIEPGPPTRIWITLQRPAAGGAQP